MQEVANLESEAARVDSLSHAADQALEDAMRFWTGDNADRFRRKAQPLGGRIRKTAQQLRQEAQSLKNRANAVRQADLDALSKIK